MHEILQLVLGYVRATWRFRWYAMLVAWLVFVAGWVYVQGLPDQFRASARVYVDTQSLLRPLLRGLAVESNLQERIGLVTRTLFSRPNLEKVARMTDLDLQAKTERDMDELLSDIRKGIRLTGTGKANLYTISYVSEDPDKAKRIVQSLLTIMVESTLGEARRDTDSAQAFLEKQIKEYEARLVAAEQRVADFRRRHAGLNPGEGGTYYQRLQVAQSQLTQAELEYQEAVNQRDTLRRQLAGEEPSFGIASTTVNSGAVQGLNARIGALEAKLDELLLKYTDRHPDVQAIQRTIADLEEQRQEALSVAAGSGPAIVPPDRNPVFQQLKVALGNAEAKVAALNVRVAEFKSRVEKLQQSIDRITKVEAELKKLNRDYDINKKNFETLLARREAAQISEDAEQSADNIKFKVVDPPRVPPKPYGPDRPVMTGGVFAGALAGGIALAFLLSQVRPTYDARRTLMDSTGIPVLGSVSMIWSSSQRRKRRIDLTLFSASTAALVLVFLGALAIQLLEVGPMLPSALRG